MERVVKRIDLTAMRERIQRERMQGDVKMACHRVKLTDTVFRTAIKKEKFTDLTAAEIRVLSAVIDVLDERIEEREKLVGA
jgi:hypothetical protein